MENNRDKLFERRNNEDLESAKSFFSKINRIFSKDWFDKIMKDLKKAQETFWKNSYSFQYYEKDWTLQVWQRYSKSVDTLIEELEKEWIKWVKNIVKSNEKESSLVLFLEETRKKFSKPTISDLTSAVSSMATLLRWWASTWEAIEETIQNIENKYLRTVIQWINEQRKVEQHLSKCFEKYSDVFDTNFVFMIKAWDKSWDYAKAFTELEYQLKLKNEIDQLKRKARTKPLISIWVLIIVLWVILIKVVPWLKWMFTQTWQTLPLPTQILMSTSDLINNNLWVIFLSIAIVFVIAKSLLWNDVSKRFFDNMFLKLPIVKNKERFENFYNTASTFDILWRSWWESTVSCLKSLKENTHNLIFKDSINEMIKQSLVWRENPIWMTVTNDRLLWKTKDYILYPLMKNGEKNSNLDEILSSEKKVIFDKYKEHTEKFISVVQTIANVTISLVIMFIVFAIFLPIMNYDPTEINKVSDSDVTQLNN